MPNQDRDIILRKRLDKWVTWQRKRGVSLADLKRNRIPFLDDNAQPWSPNTPRLPPTPPPPPQPPAEGSAPFETSDHEVLPTVLVPRPPPPRSSAANDREWWVPPLPPAERSAANDSVWWPLPPNRDESSAAENSRVWAYETSPAETAPALPSDRGSIGDREALAERPFKRHKGSGKLGSNGIRLEEPSCAEAQETRKFPDPMPALTDKEIQLKFCDGTYTRPREGFWRGEIIKRGMRVLWRSTKKGANGWESTKVVVKHGVVRGIAAKHSLFVS